MQFVTAVVCSESSDAVGVGVVVLFMLPLLVVGWWWWSGFSLVGFRRFHAGRGWGKGYEDAAKGSGFSCGRTGTRGTRQEE